MPRSRAPRARARSPGWFEQVAASCVSFGRGSARSRVSGSTGHSFGWVPEPFSRGRTDRHLHGEGSERKGSDDGHTPCLRSGLGAGRHRDPLRPRARDRTRSCSMARPSALRWWRWARRSSARSSCSCTSPARATEPCDVTPSAGGGDEDGSVGKPIARPCVPSAPDDHPGACPHGVGTPSTSEWSLRERGPRIRGRVIHLTLWRHRPSQTDTSPHDQMVARPRCHVLLTRIPHRGHPAPAVRRGVVCDAATHQLGVRSLRRRSSDEQDFLAVPYRWCRPSERHGRQAPPRVGPRRVRGGIREVTHSAVRRGESAHDDQFRSRPDSGRVPRGQRCGGSIFHEFVAGV